MYQNIQGDNIPDKQVDDTANKQGDKIPDKQGEDTSNKKSDDTSNEIPIRYVLS